MSLRTKTTPGFLFAILAVAALSGAAAVAQPANVPFDSGAEGWHFAPNCTEIHPDGGQPGAYLNFSNVCDGTGNLQGWFTVRHDSDPDFLGDYTLKGDVRISVDLEVEFYDFIVNPPIAAEEYRELVIELVDYDDPPAGYPYVSVWFNAGALPARGTGWRTFTADVVDVFGDELPEGWGGYGAEDPETYEPILPPDRTWTDVIDGVDEIRLTTLVPGFFYSLDFLHSINVDNIGINAIPAELSCFGQPATVFVDGNGVVNGGRYDGTAYAGFIAGTSRNDVIMGTDGSDVIYASSGDDVICAGGGDDRVNAHGGTDLIDGGSGNDYCRNGASYDNCETTRNDRPVTQR
jgi:hypothetical protein